MSEELIKLIKQIADYIIETECSYRLAERHFKEKGIRISKTTIGKYMRVFLPKIDMIRYEKVENIINYNTSSNIQIEDILRIEQEYILYLDGYTMEQIADLTSNNYSLVQRDLSNTLEKIDKKNFKQVQEIKRNNIAWNTMSEEEQINLVSKIELYYLLCMRGYKIKQIAYLTNSNYSTVQRGLKLLAIINFEKYNLVKEQLEYDQEKTKIKCNH